MNSNIKQIRINTQMTQEEFAKLLCVPIKTLRNWEQEIRKPNEWTLDLIIDKVLSYQHEKTLRYDEEKGVLSYLTIKKIVLSIASKYDIDKIYLFGSYAKGQARDYSDIDLYMESSLFGLEYFEFAELLREALGKKVDLLSNKTVEKDSKVEQEIKKTGLLIYER